MASLVRVGTLLGRQPNVPSACLFTFTDRTFAVEVLEAPIPVLVEFCWWFGTSGHSGAVLDRLATEVAGRMRIGRLDVCEHGRIPSAFGVLVVPMLVLFHRGRVVEQLTGLASKPRIVALLRPHLPSQFVA